MSPKKGFKIGEVCKLLDIQPYVLRYWETEFVALHPAKSQSGQRVYAEAEVAVIRRIKELLYDEGYTIAGAKKKLESRDTELVGEGEVKPSLFDLDPPAQAEPAAAVAESVPKAESAAAAAAQLDTGSADRIESFLRGVEEALAEARAALAILERHPR
ncbi:MAG: MerR family transcriptional regulator [Thermoanaerobaculia bacterium]|nr:MerR family transcriptional regulator [Thermoanaerobaculia bacterium]